MTAIKVQLELCLSKICWFVKRQLSGLAGTISRDQCIQVQNCGRLDSIANHIRLQAVFSILWYQKKFVDLSFQAASVHILHEPWLRTLSFVTQEKKQHATSHSRNKISANGFAGAASIDYWVCSLVCCPCHPSTLCAQQSHLDEYMRTLITRAALSRIIQAR